MLIWKQSTFRISSMVLLLTKVQKILKSQCKVALATLTLWFQRTTLFHFTHAQLWLDDFFRQKRSSPALLFGNFTVLSLRASSRKTFVITIHKLFKEQWHFLTNEKKKKYSNEMIFIWKIEIPGFCDLQWFLWENGQYF